MVDSASKNRCLKIAVGAQRNTDVDSPEAESWKSVCIRTSENIQMVNNRPLQSHVAIETVSDRVESIWNLGSLSVICTQCQMLLQRSANSQPRSTRVWKESIPGIAEVDPQTLFNLVEGKHESLVVVPYACASDFCLIHF